MKFKPAAVKPSRKFLILLATIIFIVAAIIYALWWFIYAGKYETTDDAYVHGYLVPVSTRVAGTIIAIDADDTEHVSAGKVLLQLDPNDYQLQLDQAIANLAQTTRQTNTLFVQSQTLQADVDMAQANIDQAHALLDKAANDYARRKSLQASGGISGEEFLHAESAYKSAQAGLAQTQAALAAAQARLQTNQALTNNTTVATHQDVLHASAAVRKAWLDLQHTRIPAAVNGMVAKRNAQLGQRVEPGATLMTLVPLDSLWVEANFKENQLHYMHPGQKVSLVSDFYGDDVVYNGTVAGISAGSGSAFAILPAQNASGNWIKVIQRVPVRIMLDPEELQQHPLRVGLSMTTKVDVSSQGQADALTTLEQQAPQSAQSTPVYDLNTDVIEQRIGTIISANTAS